MIYPDFRTPGGSPNGASFEAITLAIPHRHALVTLAAQVLILLSE